MPHVAKQDPRTMNDLKPNPSIRNRAVCSKHGSLIGTLAQLSRTVRRAARTPGTHRPAVQTGVPISNPCLERTGPIDLLLV